MMENIIEGILAARYEAEKRGIEANAVLINDRQFFSKVLHPMFGEMPLVCGLKAFYHPTLPEQVIFAVTHVPGLENYSKRCDNVHVVRCGECKWFDPDYLDEDGTFWCEHTGAGRFTRHDYCSHGAKRDGEGADYPSVSLSADTSRSPRSDPPFVGKQTFSPDSGGNRPDKGRQGREDDTFMTAFRASL